MNIYSNLEVVSKLLASFNLHSSYTPILNNSSTIEDILFSILECKNTNEAAQLVKSSSKTICKIIKSYGVTTGNKGGNMIYYLLNHINLIKCSKCCLISDKTSFNKDTARMGGAKNICKSCSSIKFREYYLNNSGRITNNTYARLAYVKRATPGWANLENIKQIYDNAEGMHVDHIIPLQGKLVCGLHVETNLQYLSPHDNYSKGNKFIP